MTDYVGMAIQGFTTGFGVIIAHECWDVIKEYKDRAKEAINNHMPRDDD